MLDYPLTDPLLIDCRSRFQKASQRADELSDSLSKAALSWKPAPDSWSVTECLEHLNVSAEAYWPELHRAIERTRERGAVSPPFRDGTLVGRFILSAVREHTKRRIKAPRLFQPAEADLDSEVVLVRFGQTQKRWHEALFAADGFDLGVRFATPVSRLARISLGQAFQIHSHHELRHLAQAERLRNLPGFLKG